ncbi:MAG: shikimate kinase [Lachnospiraceae bacterium]|nr:shikimate kinase [Lachnospiraceae bacterium]
MDSMDNIEKVRESGKHIFLIGFMGAGKSTVAAKLKELLQVRQLEMDQVIVEQKKMPIAEIFEKHGEAYFRDLETGLLLALQQEKQAVISCGGGVVVREENVRSMKENGRIVLLTAEPETIYSRVRYSKERPILNQNMSVDFIRELMEKRRTLYEAAADITVSTDGKSAAEISREILDRLAEKVESGL